MHFTSIEFGHGILLYIQSPGSFNFLSFVELIMSISTSNAEGEQIISLDKQTWTDCSRPQNIDYVKLNFKLRHKWRLIPVIHVRSLMTSFKNILKKYQNRS